MMHYCDQYEGSKSKMKPKDAPSHAGRATRPTPNPSLAGGGTNPSIARMQDAMWSKPKSTRVASQFEGK